MESRIKKVISIILCVMFMVCLVVPTTVSASRSPQRTAKCPRCGKVNTNYGCQEKFSTRVLRADPGEICDGCNRTVPTGEYHNYYVHYDLYYFLCNSNNCKNISMPDNVYTQYFFNSITDHSITKKK